MAQPLTPMEDLIIYELHVRDLPMHGSSAVLHPGTFEGLVEKLPLSAGAGRERGGADAHI